ncbi:MAG: prolipoprotein diacylglyceryl transferase [Patescibacteria group bacterium]
MLPYFGVTYIPLGPLNIQVWGLLVSLGIGAAILVSYYQARKKGLDEKKIIDLAFWVILPALIGGRVFYILTELDKYQDNFWDVFKIWEGGMTVSGGFIGAVIGGVVYLKVKKMDLWKYADVGVFGLPLGLFIGRLGCFFVFDHPGKPTSFFLGQEFVDGVIRHNHGLYLSLNGLILFIIFLILNRKNHKAPFYSIIFLIYYGVVRFFLDFWRAWDGPFTDARFYNLTAAQWFALGMVVLGVILLFYRKRIVDK